MKLPPQIKPRLLPLVASLVLVVLIVLSIFAFMRGTQNKLDSARNSLVGIHNQVSLLPQPETIQLSILSGNLDGQIEQYRRLLKRSEDIRSTPPSQLRLKISALFNGRRVASSPANYKQVYGEYVTFIETHSELLESLQKTLGYDPDVDFQEFDPESSDTQARIKSAEDGLQTTYEQIDALTDVDSETKAAILTELETLQGTANSLRQGNFTDWEAQVASSQKKLRSILQNNWHQEFDSFNTRKQQLVDYYSNPYQ